MFVFHIHRPSVATKLTYSSLQEYISIQHPVHSEHKCFGNIFHLKDLIFVPPKGQLRFQQTIQGRLTLFLQNCVVRISTIQIARLTGFLVKRYVVALPYNGIRNQSDTQESSVCSDLHGKSKRLITP